MKCLIRCKKRAARINILYLSDTCTNVRIDYTGSSTMVYSRSTPIHYEWLVTQNNTTVQRKGSTIVLDVTKDMPVSCISTNLNYHPISIVSRLDAIHFLCNTLCHREQQSSLQVMFNLLVVTLNSNLYYCSKVLEIPWKCACFSIKSQFLFLSETWN